jgi:hypothetical protein
MGIEDVFFGGAPKNENEEGEQSNAPAEGEPLPEDVPDNLPETSEGKPFVANVEPRDPLDQKFHKPGMGVEERDDLTKEEKDALYEKGSL